MGRKKLYATEEERKAARAKYDDKYYRRNRKKILKKQKKRYIERQLTREAEATSTNKNQIVAHSPSTMPLSKTAPKRVSRARRQVNVIDGHVTEWRKIVGSSAKAYCVDLYTSALVLNGDAAFRYLSDAHDALDKVLTDIGSALNVILEASGANCKEYRLGEEKVAPVKRCVSAVFDLWEAAAEDEMEHPNSLERTFGWGGFKFQSWGDE